MESRALAACAADVHRMRANCRLRKQAARRARCALAGILALALVSCASAPSMQEKGGSSPPATPPAEMVRVALSMLGQPYRYGGAAPGGFDCSGLVQFAANGAGIHLPRTARDQLRAGAQVSRTGLRAGDLVFMHLAHKELHVGIVIDEGNFVHAPSAGAQVRIDRLSAPPYAKGFLSARRLVAGP